MAPEPLRELLPIRAVPETARLSVFEKKTAVKPGRESILLRFVLVHLRACSLREPVRFLLLWRDPVSFAKRFIVLLLCLCLLTAGTPRTAPETPQATVSFPDSCGRTVEVPEKIDRIAVSGLTAQMFLITLAPELLVGVASRPSEAQQRYLPACLAELPELGQLYGGRGTLNIESLIREKPQIILDLGDRKANHAEDMQAIQEQTGIPTVFIEADGENLPEAYRMLGKLLGKQDEAEVLAQYIEAALALAETNRAKIASPKTVLFGTGVTGLDCNQRGSVQARNIEIVGGENVLVSETMSNKNGGCSIDLEELMALDPDVILLTADGFYDLVWQDDIWSKLRAVKSGCVYEIPALPYGWMSSPPSVNQVLGIYWLGKLLYPALYDYDMVEKTQEFFRLFWHCELSREEAQALLANSILK